MAKKINFGEINATTMSVFSNYHVATLELKSLADTFKADKKVLEDEKALIIENFNNDREAGLELDECKRKWSTVEVDKKLAALAVKYKADCEPHKNSVKECLKLVPDTIYEGYKSAMDKGELAGLTKTIQTFLNEIGVSAPETATSKFAQIMSVRCSGVRKASRKAWADGNYVSNKSSRQFKDIFMLAFLQYVITEKGVIDVNDDGTLTMHDFSADTNEK